MGDPKGSVRQANEYELRIRALIFVEICHGSNTESCVRKTKPYWHDLGNHQTVCSLTVVETVMYAPAPGTACPKYWDAWHDGPLPTNVADALQKHADNEKKANPGTTVIDYPFSYPDPDEGKKPSVTVPPPHIPHPEHEHAHEPHRPEDEISPQEKAIEEFMKGLEEGYELERD